MNRELGKLPQDRRLSLFHKTPTRTPCFVQALTRQYLSSRSQWLARCLAEDLIGSSY